MRKLLILPLIFLLFAGVGTRDFDNSGDYVTASGSSGLDMTMVTWVRPESRPSGTNPDYSDMIINTYSRDNTNGYIGVYQTSTGSIQTKAQSSASGQKFRNATGTMADETWNFVGVGQDNTNSLLQVSMNGETWSQTSFDPVQTLSSGFAVGRHNLGSGYEYYFDGYMSFASVYHRVLTDAELNEIMWKPEGIGNAYLFLPMWQTGASETDLSGNGRTGTVTGTQGTAQDSPPVFFGGGLPL